MSSRITHMETVEAGMHGLLWNTYHETLAAARSFTIFRKLNCFPNSQSRQPSMSSSHTAREDINLLGTTQEAPDQRMQSSGSTISYSGESRYDATLPKEELVSEIQTRFTEGPPKFVVAKDDDGETCLALLVTERMIKVLNEIAEDDAQRDAAELALEKLEKQEYKLQSLMEALETAAGSSNNQERDSQESEKVSRLRSELGQIGDNKRHLQKTIQTFERNAGFGKDKSQQMFEKAMDEANLLNRAEIRSSETVLEDECDKEGDKAEVDDSRSPAISEVRTENGAETSMNERENVLRAAQKEYEEAETALFRAQCEFDRKEYHYQAELAEFERAAEVGDTDWTMSQFDRRAILTAQDLTRDLIDAERAYDKARDHAEKIGVFDDGWGQSSYYGHSQCTGQSIGDGQIPEGGFACALSSERENLIASWAADVGDSGYVEEAVSMEVDEWDCRPVEPWDSISTFEYGPLKRRIDGWHRWCDEHRLEWQPQQPGPTGFEPVESNVLSRRESCTL
ncbi:MAG: hypothetical protein Q9163_005611 [Psora crenata]